MLSQPDFWVGVSFVLFIGLLIYLKVPAMVTKALDDRAQAIEDELADAQRLREEAQALLNSYEKKRKEAEAEAAAIVEQAKAEAQAYAAETRKKLEESVSRRGRLAEEKIAQAEVAAVKQVRSAATDLAIAAASEIIASKAQGAEAAKLIDGSIDALKGQLN